MTETFSRERVFPRLRTILSFTNEVTLSIQPPSDIVLDVANAAGAPSSSPLFDRLRSASAIPSTEKASFSTLMEDVAAGDKRSSSILPLFSPQPKFEAHTGDTKTKVFKDLEAVLLRNFIESMLPKDMSDIYGHGSAGDMWKSMLADQLSKELSKRIDLGLSRTAATRLNYARIFSSS
ncbi:rod-binding protein [Beijerinckia mobilis]|uniref:rod-binding protein n=1 Tax=Beijerinckia mobilis TaxID=231434 RepID=UPI000A03C1D0|nr:rod-binding protein [Beijerinckia mobilis]